MSFNAESKTSSALPTVNPYPDSKGSFKLTYQKSVESIMITFGLEN
jgi:hypothetical protein